LPASQIISSLHEAVLRFAGGTRQLDDLTAVVVKRLA
jgi:serine phosphatase RsbU (regulator of sigma subunit)